MVKVKRKVLLNPGPATTSDNVKLAQVVPDICPREKEFQTIMKHMCSDLVHIVHGDTNRFAAVLFCGSGTICIDVCLSSLIDKDKKILIISNGAYSSRAVDVCRYYALPHIELRFPDTELPELDKIEKTFRDNQDIGLVYATHHETGTGLLNPIREIGEIAHRNDAIFVVDTISSYAMIPIDIEYSNIDFCMASSQKGLASMTGLSFVIGNKSIIESTKDFPLRSYYCNLYRQYMHFEENGETHFTPPVQTIYATQAAIKEYFEEGELNKWSRHKSIYKSLRDGAKSLGFRETINSEYQSELVLSLDYPHDPKWSFSCIHDYCYENGFTIYPGKTHNNRAFRLCAFGAINTQDIENFFSVFISALKYCGVETPVKYN